MYFNSLPPAGQYIRMCGMIQLPINMDSLTRLQGRRGKNFVSLLSSPDFFIILKQ